MNVKDKTIAFVSEAFTPPSQPGTPRSWNLTKFLVNNGYRLKVYIHERNYMTAGRMELINGENHEFEIIPVKTVKNHRESVLHRVMHYVLFSIGIFLKTLPDKEIDILYLTTPPLLIHWFGYIVKVLKKKPIVLEIKDMHPEASRALGFPKSRLVYELWLKIENFFRARMDLIVALTPTMYERLKEYGFGNVILVPNIFYQEEADILDVSKYNYILRHFNNNFIVLYTGSMGYAQDLETIVNSAYILQKKGYSEIKFIFIGDGEKRGIIKDMIQNYKLKNVLIFNAIPRRIIRYIQTKADVLISAYFDNEIFECNLPNRIFDYHGAGKPIVISGKGDVADLVRKARSGIAVVPEKPEEIAKAIEYLYEHPEEAKKMGEKGRRYIMDNFNESKTFGLLLKSMENLLSVHRKRNLNCGLSHCNNKQKPAT